MRISGRRLSRLRWIKFVPQHVRAEREGAAGASRHRAAPPEGGTLRESCKSAPNNRRCRSRSGAKLARNSMFATQELGPQSPFRAAAGHEPSIIRTLPSLIDTATHPPPGLRMIPGDQSGGCATRLCSARPSGAAVSLPPIGRHWRFRLGKASGPSENLTVTQR